MIALMVNDASLFLNFMFTSLFQEVNYSLFYSFRQSQSQGCHWFCHRMRCSFARNIHFVVIQSSLV